MRKIGLALVLGTALSGCGTGSSSGPAAGGTVTPSARLSSSPVATRVPAVAHATIAVDASFARAVRTLCHALGHKDAGAVTAALPYYQYNSGLRYGRLGDGEGQTGDPSLMASWLARSQVQCRFQSSGSHGHGTFLATGWPQPGGTALIELDTYAGHWKINDFTFGNYRALVAALQTAKPIVPYSG